MALPVIYIYIYTYIYIAGFVIKKGGDLNEALYDACYSHHGAECKENQREEKMPQPDEDGCELETQTLNVLRM